MRVAFYAPMKAPAAAVPSGDREMARNFLRALDAAGQEVCQPSRFVSRDGGGDGRRQERLAALGAALADRLVRRWRAAAAAPEAWLTYHVYHKSPDWLGPPVRAALGIPYLIAEASHAPKQAGGKWDLGYRGAEAAIRAADAVIGLSSRDAACVRPLLRSSARYHELRPFTDTAPFATAAAARHAPRAAPALVTVAMMRHGDKLASYRVLAAALAAVADLPWRLTVVGDGPARGDVEAAFGGWARDRVEWTGAVAPEALPAVLAGADVMVWPAVNEAYGMALLEAQSAGLPVVAGRSGGVPDIVRDGETGLLTAPGDADAFAAALRILLRDDGRRRRMSESALRITQAEHDLGAAAGTLATILAGCR